LRAEVKAVALVKAPLFGETYGSLSLTMISLSAAAFAQGRSAPKVAAKDTLVVFRVAAGWHDDQARIWCRFGLRNMGVAHAGDNFPNSGRHYPLVDVNEPT
jgi:hypothetical protein